ncbi:heavy metal transporter [Pseudalgibacter alginicilyticus]|uniref:Heavy metal transporter n=1 Tax=Pseudalgibacter alginicilyticus TaxID=1736674 RepID=A0A0P0CIQ8_9FLAO|nr:heavy-metal-associated domain-containing protein [Pseudalgibacter alginicilyticus]ALJ04251.1 heavy metal transporter [Pseudalgibacter alginicilyticus]
MKTSVIVQNLKCGGCSKTITNKLSEIENISDISIDIDEGKVSFNYLNSTDVLSVKNKLKTLGYPTIDDDNNIVSKAKSYVSCATGKFS